MSLRRRITLATTLAVALVAIGVGVAGYSSTRSRLMGSVRSELTRLVDDYLQIHHQQLSGGTPGQTGTAGSNPATTGGQTNLNQNPYYFESHGHKGFGVPNPPALGGAPGYFQTVTTSGTTIASRGGKGVLPVTKAVVNVAKSGHGRFYFDAVVAHTHVEVLTAADSGAHTAIEVALPLSSDDSVLNALLVSYAVIVGLGVLLAGVIGAFVARSALSPISRFTARTEQVTGAIDAPGPDALTIPHRLDGGGASELQRLAASFNQTLDALERAVQAQRHLIADASHELRTPMAALRSNVQIFLEADQLPDEDRGDLQESILAELDELTQLVADVLDLARGAAPSEHVEVIELDSIVSEAISRSQRRKPTLKFVTELQPTVIVNAHDRVTRAVSNVIDNACKWSDGEGQIDIALGDGRLTVRDHGPGFQEADLDHVFDRFYRAHEARRLPGSGLGLAIVKQAAEAYGGSVRAYNAPDGGAVIELRFGSRGPAPISADSLTSI